MSTHEAHAQMTRRGLLRAGALGGLLLAAGAATRRAEARAIASSPQITIIAPLVWLRNAPALNAGNSVPVRKGEFYGVRASSADKRWLQLDVPSANGRGTWLYAALGAFPNSDSAAVPVVSTAVASTPKAPKKPAPFPTWVPSITSAQRAIWQKAASMGKLTSMFTVIGDCNSQPPVYLQRVATGEFDSNRVDARMQATVLRFGDAFGRISLAAKGGFGSANMLDPTWADGALCGTQQGPFECEVWVSRASIVFIELGTGDQLAWQDFEKNYRPLVQLTLNKGALPVLVTKADDIETSTGAKSGHINAIVRKTAAEFAVPLYDFHAATRGLPNLGLLDEGDKDFHLNDAGMYRHIEGTLQTLAAITLV
jgi:hypothetical protein